jgi:hypothetical protein
MIASGSSRQRRDWRLSGTVTCLMSTQPSNVEHTDNGGRLSQVVPRYCHRHGTRPFTVFLPNVGSAVRGLDLLPI